MKLTDVILLAALAFVVYGIWLLNEPGGLIAAGVSLGVVWWLFIDDVDDEA